MTINPDQPITTLRIREGRQIAGNRRLGDQAVTVSRTTDGGVAVVMTPAAADQLAQVLIRHYGLDTAVTLGNLVTASDIRVPALQPVPHYDEMLWITTAVDLVAAKTLASIEPSEPVYVPLAVITDENATALADVEAVAR